MILLPIPLISSNSLSLTVDGKLALLWRQNSCFLLSTFKRFRFHVCTGIKCHTFSAFGSCVLSRLLYSFKLNKKRDCRFTRFPLKIHRNATDLAMNISEFINDIPVIFFTRIKGTEEFNYGLNLNRFSTATRRRTWNDTKSMPTFHWFQYYFQIIQRKSLMIFILHLYYHNNVSAKFYLFGLFLLLFVSRY